MLESQQSIWDWARATFGPVASNKALAERANKEMRELLEALESDDDHPKAVEECADIVIVLSQVAQRMGKNLFEEIDRKMVINRARTWKLDGNGCGSHVREPEGV